MAFKKSVHIIHKNFVRVPARGQIKLFNRLLNLKPFNSVQTQDLALNNLQGLGIFIYPHNFIIQS